MKPLFKTLFCVLLLQSVIGRSLAQEYLVDLRSDRIRLYIGYVDVMRVSLFNAGDPINDFKIHVQADGADIEYENDGKMKVLPTQKEGTIRLFAEKNGKFYKVSGRLKFEGVKAPVNDQTFISTMGITKDDPKTKLKNPHQFILPKNQKLEDSKLEMEWFQLNYLKRGELNKVKVWRIMIKKDGEYVPQKGDIGLRSDDAAVRKLNSNTFDVTILPDKKRCKLSIYLDDKKIDDKMVDIFPLMDK